MYSSSPSSVICFFVHSSSSSTTITANTAGSRNKDCWWYSSGPEIISIFLFVLLKRLKSWCIQLQTAPIQNTFKTIFRFKITILISCLQYLLNITVIESFIKEEVTCQNMGNNQWSVHWELRDRIKVGVIFLISKTKWESWLDRRWKKK